MLKSGKLVGIKGELLALVHEEILKSYARSERGLWKGTFDGLVSGLGGQVHRLEAAVPCADGQ